MEPTTDELAAIVIDETGYDYQERLAIMSIECPDLHPAHLRNRAIKSQRILKWQEGRRI